LIYSSTYILGGGIDKSALPSIWNFIKLESKNISQHPEIVAKVRELIPINISMGIGLPMSQVYANYWGGNISIYSMDRFGTDAYVTLITGNSQERLEYTKHPF
jgi:pyruvate dehydrogenase kinase 2/3/4